MLLVLPVPEVQVGPDWAQNIVDALQKIDTHDHSSNNGAKVTPAGILINANLDMKSYKAINSLAVAFSDAGATDLEPGKLYRIGQNLWYNNQAGVPVQITSGTAVAAPGAGAFVADVPASYPYSVVSGDAQKVLLIDSSASRTINLPPATNAMFFTIKDATGLAQTNNITVTPNLTDLIEGVNASFVMNENYGARGFISDGLTSWYVI